MSSKQPASAPLFPLGSDIYTFYTFSLTYQCQSISYPQRCPEDASASDHDSDTPSEEYDEINMADPAQVEAMIQRAKARVEKKQKRKQAEAAAKGPDTVKLSRLTSISGSRGVMVKPPTGPRKMVGGGGGGGGKKAKGFKRRK
jgi:hypothetical protein